MMAKPQILSFTQPTALPLGPSQIILSYLCREEMFQSSGSQSGDPRLGTPASRRVIRELLQTGMGSKKYLSGDGNFAKDTL